MFAQSASQAWRRSTGSVLFALLVATALNPLYAQSPCPPDASGDFKPTQSVTCQLPESGELSYRDVVIPPNVTISFARNSRNTPVTIKVSGNFTLNGAINVGGFGGTGRFGGKGGNGAFDGGKGGSFLDSRAGGTGDGPGSGAGGPANSGYAGGGSYARPGGSGGASHGAAGAIYGTTTLLPLIGGSGGGGGGAGDQGVGGGGGGGGGAILIFCAGTATFEFKGGCCYGINASGGGGSCNNGTGRSGSGGSGGAIRIVADTIIGDPGFSVAGGGVCGSNGFSGGEGYIRVEARDLSRFSSANPTITTSLTRGPATLTNNPQLKIKSVGGQNAPATPSGSFYLAPDITVPTSVANPVAVAVEGTNIPVGTTIQVILTKESGEKETKTCALAGSPAACSASVTLPTSGVSVVTATVTIDVLVAFGGPRFIEGERVDKVEIATAFGSESQVTYITQSGRRIRRTE
jgi:hypothetical protein